MCTTYMRSFILNDVRIFLFLLIRIWEGYELYYMRVVKKERLCESVCVLGETWNIIWISRVEIPFGDFRVPLGWKKEISKPLMNTKNILCQ